MTNEPQSGAALLARIRPTLAEETAEVCLRADLLDAWNDLSEKLVELDDARPGRLADKPSPEKIELARQVQLLEEQIADATVTFHFRALPQADWRALCDQHPPRKSNDLDAYAGYNRDAVLDAAVRACLYDPVFDAASWDEFTAVVNSGEWDQLRNTVNSVNRGVVQAPKSALASRILNRVEDI